MVYAPRGITIRIYFNLVDTQRCFNVDTTSYDVVRHRVVQTTLKRRCVSTGKNSWLNWTQTAYISTSIVYQKAYQTITWESIIIQTIFRSLKHSFRFRSIDAGRYAHRKNGQEVLKGWCQNILKQVDSSSLFLYHCNTHRFRLFQKDFPSQFYYP